MALSFKFYDDAALANERAILRAVQQADGSSGPVDFQVFLGSTTASRRLRNGNNPGVDELTVEVIDRDAATGHPSSEIKLASTAAGLDSATGGASLNLGTEIRSGSANAVSFHVRVEDSTQTVGLSDELSLQISNAREEPDTN